MGYLDPEFSPLPEGWASKQLKDVVEIHNTKRKPLSARVREGRKGKYPYCGANAVVDHIDDYRFDGEFVLIAEDGGHWGKHESSSYIMRGKFWVNNHAHVVCAKDGKTTNVFFTNIVNYLNVDPFIGGDARGKLTKAILQQLEIPLPPLPEQKKIAHVLSTVQRAIEAQERIIQTTTELKKTLMHKLFTEGLHNEPQKQTEIGPVPESWEVVSFEKFVVLQRGYDLRKQEFRDGTVPVIGATQIIGHHDTAIVKGPGVTVVRSGSSAGKPLFISEEFWPHNVVLFVRDFHGNVPKFVYYNIQSLDLTRYRQGVAVPTLNRNTFRSIQTALPPREEQGQIADTLDSVEKKSQVAARKKTALQDLFRTLLHELMTAKTRVHSLSLK